MKELRDSPVAQDGVGRAVRISDAGQRGTSESYALEAQPAIACTKLSDDESGGQAARDATVAASEQAFAKLIEEAVRAAQSGPRGPRDWQIDIGGGMITVTGKAISEAERRAVTAKLKTVPGVACIDNRLVVKGA